MALVQAIYHRACRYLLGIGVLNIYFTVAWRAGTPGRFLQSSLTRAVIFRRATASLATLWLSRHPVPPAWANLIVSLFLTLVTAFSFRPPLLGPPPPDHKRARQADFVLIPSGRSRPSFESARAPGWLFPHGKADGGEDEGLSREDVISQ